MSMSVITPTVVTDAMLIGSTVAEDGTPVYNPATTYPMGAEVHLPSTHRVYKSLQAGNLNNTPNTSPAWWFNARPTNRWAMFDHYKFTATTASDDIVLVLQPGPISGIFAAQLSGVRAIDVVQRREPGGEIVYSESQNLSSVAIVDWRSWTLAPFKYRNRAAFLGLAPYLGSEVTITLRRNGLQDVSVGVLAPGVDTVLGTPQKGIARGGINYSRVTTDAYGTDTFVPGARTDDIDFEVHCTVADLDTVCETLNEAKAVPSGFVPSTRSRYSALMCWGVVDDFKAGVPEYDSVVVRGRIRGLT